MICDLERVFGSMADIVPTSPTGDADFIFSARTLPVPPAEMVTDRLILTKTTHNWHPAWRVADLLLNAGRPENPATEYQLEGEGGIRGVGEHSAEMRIFLPGSLGWTDEL